MHAMLVLTRIAGQRWSGSRREVRVLAVGAAAAGCGAGR